jgi:hypothetical protein
VPTSQALITVTRLKRSVFVSGEVADVHRIVERRYLDGILKQEETSGGNSSRKRPKPQEIKIHICVKLDK